MKNKLTLAQKLIRKNLLLEQYKVFIYDRVTVAYHVTGECKGHFAVAIAAEGEKFSRKYGEFIALQRIGNGVFLPFEFKGANDLEDVLAEIAMSLQSY